MDDKSIDQVDSALQYIDGCRIGSADVTAYYPNGQTGFQPQVFWSNGANYADGGAYACNRFAVDVNIPTLKDSIPWPYGNKGANIRFSASAPNSPEMCSTYHAYVRVYSKSSPQESFTLVAWANLSGQWLTPGSGASYCALSGGPSVFHAQMGTTGNTTYRYTVSANYGGSFQPVHVTVEPQM